MAGQEVASWGDVGATSRRASGGGVAGREVAGRGVAGRVLQVYWIGMRLRFSLGPESGIFYSSASETGMTYP